MKLFKKINIFLWRIDGIISLLCALVAFVCLLQCALGVQGGITILQLPVITLAVVCVVMLARFFDWLLLVDRKTRFKVVKGKVNTMLETWRMEKYNVESEEKENEK